MIIFDDLKEDIRTVFNQTPDKPFLCLPLSAYIYAVLRDNYGLKVDLVTGHLTFNGCFIFKQDFSLLNFETDETTYWGGHSWVLLENELIIDMSFLRTLHSDEFDKPYKNEILNIFESKKCPLVFRVNEMLNNSLQYHAVDLLSDDMVTGIIKGSEILFSNNISD